MRKDLLTILLLCCGWCAAACDVFTTQGFAAATLAEERWWAEHPNRTHSGKPTYWSGTNIASFVLYWCPTGGWRIGTTDKWPADWTEAGRECSSAVATRVDKGTDFAASGEWAEGSGTSTPVFTCGGVILLACGGGCDGWPQGYPLTPDGKSGKCQPLRQCGANTNDLYVSMLLRGDAGNNVTVGVYRDSTCNTAVTAPAPMTCGTCAQPLRNQLVTCASVDAVVQSAPGPDEDTGLNWFLIAALTAVFLVMLVVLGVYVARVPKQLGTTRRREQGDPMLVSEMRDRDLVDEADLVERLHAFFESQHSSTPHARTPDVDALVGAALGHESPRQFLFDKLLPYYRKSEKVLKDALYGDAPAGRKGQPRKRRPVPHEPAAQLGPSFSSQPSSYLAPAPPDATDAENDAEAALAALEAPNRTLMGSFVVNSFTGSSLSGGRPPSSLKRPLTTSKLEDGI
eukprot:TRINITY_DN18368_c0_g1_i1.p1 TRINITY_DN18368_c0_g1~~TRINITY_DN18368_c0_g1_i1.p1  ORF type:complete len:456 (+),score=102.72 TRINITY_DN18368_c0_g1_i1:115-1482(+)